MNQIQVIQALNSMSSLSWYYDHAPNGTRLPFGVIHCSQPQGVRADDRTLMRRWEFRLDIYTAEKSLDLESDLEEVIEALEVPWTQDENFLDGQDCWEVEYSFEVIGNATRDEELHD